VRRVVDELVHGINLRPDRPAGTLPAKSSGAVCPTIVEREKCHQNDRYEVETRHLPLINRGSR
jgi:hypothetical protein